MYRNKILVLILKPKILTDLVYLPPTFMNLGLPCICLFFSRNRTGSCYLIISSFLFFFFPFRMPSELSTMTLTRSRNIWHLSMLDLWLILKNWCLKKISEIFDRLLLTWFVHLFILFQNPKLYWLLISLAMLISFGSIWKL